MVSRVKGFTLVELSIVLVIIGLLIGGILAAQSMISTAKVNSVAMQIGQFDAGVENFKTKYNYLPGDAPAFGGDGDGYITNGVSDGVRNGLNAYSGEILNFWGDMFSDKYTTYTTLPPATAPTAPPNPNPPNANVPSSKLGISGSFFIASALANDSYYISGQSSNWYGIISPSSIPSVPNPASPGGLYYELIPNPASTSAVKPIESLALDSKIDDGNPLAGNVQATQVFGSNNSGELASYAGPVANCVSNGSYNLTYTSYACTPIIRIGAGVNDPQ